MAVSVLGIENSTSVKAGDKDTNLANRIFNLEQGVITWNAACLTQGIC